MSASPKREHTPSFIGELPLRAEAAAVHALNARLEAARQVYNACLGEVLRRARLLRERRAYRKAHRVPKGEERTAAFRAARRWVEFTDAALQWGEATQPARGRAFCPSSFGAPPRGGSGSPAEEGIAKAEAPDVVAPACAGGESRGEVAVVPLGTPRL